MGTIFRDFQVVGMVSVLYKVVPDANFQKHKHYKMIPK